jgi:hypothetical protein
MVWRCVDRLHLEYEAGRMSPVDLRLGGTILSAWDGNLRMAW